MILQKILGRHFPTNTPDPNDLRLPIFIGGLIYFILAVLEPFGTAQSVTPYKPIRFIGHGVIVGVIVYIFQNIIPGYFAKYYNVHNWTLGKALLHGFCGFLSIGISLYLYTRVAFPKESFAPEFLDFMR